MHGTRPTRPCRPRGVRQRIFRWLVCCATQADESRGRSAGALRRAACSLRGVALRALFGSPQERKKAAQEGLRFLRLTGGDIRQQHWDAFYKFYRNTTGGPGAGGAASAQGQAGRLALRSPAGEGAAPGGQSAAGRGLHMLRFVANACIRAHAPAEAPPLSSRFPADHRWGSSNLIPATSLPCIPLTAPSLQTASGAAPTSRAPSSPSWASAWQTECCWCWQRRQTEPRGTAGRWRARSTSSARTRCLGATGGASTATACPTCTLRWGMLGMLGWQGWQGWVRPRDGRVCGEGGAQPGRATRWGVGGRGSCVGMYASAACCQQCCVLPSLKHAHRSP